MGTPFDTIHAPTFDSTLVASHAQLSRAIGPMLADRDWTKGADSWVKRIAVISTTLGIAEQAHHDLSLVESLKVDLSDRGDLWLTFHELMAFGQANDTTEENLYRPLTKRGASQLIDYLRTLPTKVQVTKEVKATTRGQAETPNQAGLPREDVVPAGRYAIDTFDGAHNDIAFYKVDRPTEGKWAGYVFVKLIVGGHDEQRVPFAMAKGVMRRIAEVGAEAAAARYGHEIGACGFCGTTLTNDESRARGIGPICAAKHGW